MTFNLVKKKVLAIATIGVGSWIIAGELRELLNQYVENSLPLKIGIALILIWIGILIGD